MKRITTYLLALVVLALVISMSVTSVFAASFVDVPEGAWYYNFVTEANEQGYMVGKPGNKFDPSGSVTRAECISILGRLCNAEQDTNNDFVDVVGTEWYAGYVGWAVRAGVTSGLPGNKFGGTNPITRQELVVMVGRFLDYIWVDLPEIVEVESPFKDDASIASWAKDKVNYIRETGVVSGTPDGYFNPTKTTTRAEMATIVVQLANAIKGTDNTPAISDTSLESYSLCSEYLSNEELTAIADIISDKTGVTVGVGGDSENKIIFAVDDSIKSLEYTITESEGNLTFNVSTEYAVGYYADIVTDALSLRDSYAIPQGFKGRGIYTLDEANNTSGLDLKCETDKNPLAYELGDDVTFRISLIQDGKLVSVPQFAYTYTPEYDDAVTGLAPGHTGQFVITMDGLDKPGSAFFKVYLANKKGVKIASLNKEILASVIFDFYNLTNVKGKPADFDEFWDGKMEELMAVEPEALSFEKCPDSYIKPGYDTYDVQIQSLNTVATAHITVPQNADPASLKMYVQFDGYGTIYSDNPEYNPDGITVSVNRHEIKNHLSYDYYYQYEQAMPNWGFNNPTREDSFFMGLIMRDIQAIRYAEIKFADLWNGIDIMVYGGSMGGFQSIAVAGLYDKVTYLQPGIPWMSDLGGRSEGRYSSIFMPEYTEGSKYYDSCYFAERYDGPVGINAGLGDDCCPSSGVTALYNSFSGTKSIIFYQCGGHGPTGGPYNGSYYIDSRNPDIDPMITDIKDNGSAVPAPNYSPDRTLTESEEEMKAITGKWNTKIRFGEISCKTSQDLMISDIEAIIKTNLVEKLGLDPTYSVVVDVDHFEAVVKAAVSSIAGGEAITMVEYTVYDNNGGYIDASARFRIKKTG